MREFLEGSDAIARTVARCRPQVVPAYPITPQTHIVEAIGRLVNSGELEPCEFITVESEFAAMSAAIGASATGSRAYTATASQGLLYMAEAVFNASGLGLPIVMTVANRAIGAPINIWNDQSDSMSQRDCGWIQLYAQDNQSAVDLHVIAFALAEALSVPVMVCVDGFVLTHAFEPLVLPTQDEVDAFLPAYAPRQVLDPAAPVTIGAMVGPEAFTEVRYLAHHQLGRVLDLLPELAARYEAVTGRSVAALSPYLVEDADTVVITLGSVSGTMHDVVDDVRSAGSRVGVVALTAFRPFPSAALRSLLSPAKRVIVVERAFAPGAGGVVAADIRQALWGLPVTVLTVIAGLGGRAIGRESLTAMLAAAEKDALDDLTFLDLHQDVIDHEIAHDLSPEAV